MARTLAHIAYVDVTVPDFILGSEHCPAAVRDAFAALDAANDAVTEAIDAHDDARMAVVSADAEIRKAVAAGKSPKVEDSRVLEARVDHATSIVHARSRDALTAAAHAEAVVRDHRVTLRKMIADRLPEAHAHAVEAIAAAQAADAAQRGLVDAMRSLDLSAAQAYPASKRRAAESAVVLAYQSAQGKDPSRHIAGRMPLAWSELTAHVGSFPVGEFVADPIKGNGDLADQFERIEQADEARRRAMENRAQFAGSRF
ncbi:hypothetical protein [Streptomyces spiralis]|uniref:hypothetical protein n=1 Tax=Streptomyces spiralis TaxID=66376 RepID=UPI00367C83DE